MFMNHVIFNTVYPSYCVLSSITASVSHAKREFSNIDSERGLSLRPTHTPHLFHRV